jgi:hypothetical protein
MALQSFATVSGYIVEHAIYGVFALQAWMVKALIDVRGDTRATRQTLFGETGENGINGTVKQHAVDLKDHEKRITHSEARWSALEGS